MKPTRTGVLLIAVIAVVVWQSHDGSCEAQPVEAQKPATPTPDAARRLGTINDASDAVARAVAFLGLDEADSHFGPAAAERVRLEQDNTPYLSDQVINRPLWRVTLPDVEAFRRGARHGQVRKWTFDLFLDSETGKLVKAITRWPDGVPPIPDEADAETAARHLAMGGGEKYEGFPDTPPETSLADALKAIEGFGDDPAGARQIVARCVVWRMGNQPPIRVWAVTLRGVRVPRIAQLGGPRDPIFSKRYIVNATTGEFITATNY